MTYFHGSDLEKIESAYGIKKESIINFSSNVNPLGLSENIITHLPKKIELIASYPDRNYTSLRFAIGSYVGLDSSHIIVGNGSTELISHCIKAVCPKNALIIGPTYSEYEREIGLMGGNVTYFPLNEIHDFKIDLESLKNTLTTNMDMLVICNPNNPTSTAIKKEELRIILQDCKEKDIFLLIDETYVEFVLDLDAISAVKLVESFDNLMVIRGVSKFFSAPGLRLGYGICNNLDLIKKIDNEKNPWTISALAAYAGELMLIDKDYIKNTHNHIAKERKKIIEELSTWDFVKFIEPVANFILVKSLKPSLKASTLFEALLKKQMMIRDTSSFPFLDEYYFRFCFLHSKQNDELLKEMKTIFNN